MGLGWSLDLPAIERSTRAGIPRADIPPVWQLRHLGDGEELTETAPGMFRQRIEPGAPIVAARRCHVRPRHGRHRLPVRPHGRRPPGRRRRPGPDGEAEQDLPLGQLASRGAVGRVETWISGDTWTATLRSACLVSRGDGRLGRHGARALAHAGGAGEAGSDAPLLSAITWNDGQARVEIIYEARLDILVSHATGQRLALAHRIAEIRTEVAGEPVRTTTLTYVRSIEAPSSRLATISTAAADGAALPTWRMTYTGEAVTPVAHEIPGAPALDPTAEGRAWVDVDGDVLPDLLDAEPGAWRFRKNIGATDIYATPSSEDGPRDRIAEQLVIDADGAQLTATRTYYDGEAEQGLPLGQLASRGAVGRVETWISGDTWTATLRQTVDPRGNTIHVRDAEDGTLERRYDAEGLFPVEERLLLPGDALITTAEWDASPQVTLHLEGRSGRQPRNPRWTFRAGPSL